MQPALGQGSKVCHPHSPVSLQGWNLLPGLQDTPVSRASFSFNTHQDCSPVDGPLDPANKQALTIHKVRGTGSLRPLSKAKGQRYPSRCSCLEAAGGGVEKAECVSAQNNRGPTVRPQVRGKLPHQIFILFLSCVILRKSRISSFCALGVFFVHVK